MSTEFVPTTAAQPGHGPVSAHLYKLLIYPVGGHFLPHVDTEKLPGHFATLLISLPVAGGHDGGVLNVYHAGRSWSWDTSRRGVDSPHAGGEARGGSGSGGAGAGGGSRKRGRGGGGGGGGSGSAAAGHVALSRIQDEPDGELDLAVEPLDVDSLREGGDVAASKSQRLGSVSDGFRFAAFFTDCVHEITPVTAGMRVMLVYNLTRTNALPLPQHFPSSSMAPMAAAPPVAAAAGRRQQRSRQSAPGSPGGAAAGQAPGKQRQEEEQALEDARRQGDEVFRWVCEQVFDHPHAPPPVNDLQGLGERVRASVRAWEDALRAQPAAPAAPALLSRAPADAAGPSSGGSIHLGPGGEQRRVPPALVLRLEHRYSNHGLGFTQLKGRDAAVAQVLQAAGGLDLYLCLMTKWVSGPRCGILPYGRICMLCRACCCWCIIAVCPVKQTAKMRGTQHGMQAGTPGGPTCDMFDVAEPTLARMATHGPHLHTIMRQRHWRRSSTRRMRTRTAGYSMAGLARWRTTRMRARARPLIPSKSLTLRPTAFARLHCWQRAAGQEWTWAKCRYVDVFLGLEFGRRWTGSGVLARAVGGAYILATLVLTVTSGWRVLLACSCANMVAARPTRAAAGRRERVQAAWRG